MIAYELASKGRQIRWNSGADRKVEMKEDGDSARIYPEANFGVFYFLGKEVKI